jgi:anti-sigma factor RsiW
MDQHEDSELGSVLKQHATRHTAPAALRKRITAAIALADDTAGEAPDTPRRKPVRDNQPSAWRNWLNVGSAFASGAAASVIAGYFFIAAAAQERLSQEMIDGHVRSLMAQHLADVASSDQHTVKPWFAGKIDFSPPVYDLSAQGFPLAGGRLDYIDGQATAALVYRRNSHIINVFFQSRKDRTSAPPDAFTARGYHVSGWKAGATQAWVVSDLNAEELTQFTVMLRKAGEEANPR